MEGGFDRFSALASEGHNVIPVTEALLADTLTPVSAFLSIADEEDGFILESVEHDERWGRYSFVGRRPRSTIVARGRALEVTHGSVPDAVPLDQGALCAL